MSSSVHLEELAVGRLDTRTSAVVFVPVAIDYVLCTGLCKGLRKRKRRGTKSTEYLHKASENNVSAYGVRSGLSSSTE